MGRVFAHISVSVDGYVADDAGGLDWWSTDDDIAVFAGARAIRTALSAGVLDELHFVVRPVLVGSGLPLFGDSPRAQALRMRETTRLGSGALLVRYSLDPRPDQPAT